MINWFFAALFQDDVVLQVMLNAKLLIFMRITGLVRAWLEIADVQGEAHLAVQVPWCVVCPFCEHDIDIMQEKTHCLLSLYLNFKILPILG